MWNDLDEYKPRWAIPIKGACPQPKLGAAHGLNKTCQNSNLN